MRVKKIIAVCMSVMSIIAMAGCGTATTDSANNSSNNTISQETIAQSTVQPTTVVVTEAVTEATTQDVGLVPPNCKLRKNRKVIAYSKDADFEGFEWKNMIGFEDDINTIIEFISNNAVIEIPAGSKIDLSHLHGYSALSDELKDTLELAIGDALGGDTKDPRQLINKKGDATCAFVLFRTNAEEPYIDLYVK